MPITDIMLKRVAVSNFKSFKDMTFDFTSGSRILNHAVIYGENGSGKTNLVKTVSFLRESISTLIIEPRMDLTDLCGLSRMISSDGPMRMRYEMRFDGNDVTYAMTFDGGLIVDEWMECTLNKRRGTLFHISKEDTRIESSFWSSLFINNRFKDDVSNDVERFWGRHSFLAIINSHMKFDNPGFVDDSMMKIVPMIEGISDISVNTNIADHLSIKGYSFLDDLETGTVHTDEIKALGAYRNAMRKFFRRAYGSITDLRYELRDTDDPNIKSYDLLFVRKIDGESITVPSVYESCGTRRLVHLFSTLVDCASGRTALIDEIDNGIHDKMIYDILTQILPEIKGQMIMTTHNTSLLRTISPRNAFVIDVDSDGYKAFSAFNDVQRTMANNNNQNRYLNNAFGGIPFVGGIGLNDIASELRSELGSS